MRAILITLAVIILLLVAAAAGTIGFDKPTAPPPQASVSEPFRAVDFSDLPPITKYPARDGAELAYRRYNGNPNLPKTDRLVILIHGSAGSSTSMHATAKALAAAGATVVAPDIRGHGESGPPGDIAYIGQLEDDLEDLLNNLDKTHHAAETTLIGFSAGGGFALRIAGSRLGPRFSRYILLAPYLRYDAPNARVGTNSGGWYDIAIPRIVALSLLSQIGITAFDGLPVLAFAVPPSNPNHLTTSYSYRLLMNFEPDDDYLGDLRRTSRPLMAMDGADDEMFLSNKLQSALDAGRPNTRVDIVPGVGHIALTTTPAATAAIAKAWASSF